MEQSRKRVIIDKISENVKKNESIDNVEVKETKVNIEVDFTYAGDIVGQVFIRKNGAIAIIKASADFDVKEDLSLDVLSDDIVEHTDFNRNLLDNNISIQQVISYGDMSDDETENMMIEQTNALLVILEKNLKYFVHSDVEKEVQKEEKAESVQDDLEEALQQTELDDAKEIPKVATKISSKKSKSHIQKDDEDDDLDELLKELEEENIEDEILEDKKAAFKRESKFNLQNVNNRKPKKKATTPKHEDSLDIDSDKNETTEDEIGHENVTKQTMEDNVTSNTNISILDKNPNIKKQIESMYADIDKLFEERKSQADKRESVLDAYADKLKKREEELEQIAKDNEKEYIKKSMELEKEYKEKEDSLSKTYIQKEIELEELQNKYEQKSNELFAEKQSLSFEYKKLQTQKDTLKSEQDNLREKEQLINEKKVNVLGVNDSVELNSIIEQLKAENEELKKQNEEAEELIDDANAKMEEVAQNSKKKDKVISKLKSRMELQSETIQEYEDKLIKMENAPKESSGSIDTSDFEDKIKDLENLLSEKDKENSTMRDNLNQEQTRYNQLNEMYLAEKKEKDELGKKLEESKNNSSTVEKKTEMSEENLIKSRANTIKQELDKIGISTDIVPSNGDFIIAGEKDGCTICVNVNAEIIYAEKSVKKAVKYQKEVEEWTQQDIRASYAILSSTNKFVCKYTYKDVSKAVMEILERFKTIS